MGSCKSTLTSGRPRSSTTGRYKLTRIEDLSDLKHLPHLTHLHAIKNRLTSLDILEDKAAFRFLVEADASFNRVKHLPAVDAPRLRHLRLSNNAITSCEAFMGHAALQVTKS